MEIADKRTSTQPTPFDDSDADLCKSLTSVENEVRIIKYAYTHYLGQDSGDEEARALCGVLDHVLVEVKAFKQAVPDGIWWRYTKLLPKPSPPRGGSHSLQSVDEAAAKAIDEFRYCQNSFCEDLEWAVCLEVMSEVRNSVARRKRRRGAR